MSNDTRKSKVLEAQLAPNGWVAHLFGRGEEVKYFDGSIYVEGEVTWSWRESRVPGELPSAVLPLHIHAESLRITNPPEARRPLRQDEVELIAERIRQALSGEKAEAIIEWGSANNSLQARRP